MISGPWMSSKCHCHMLSKRKSLNDEVTETLDDNRSHLLTLRST